MPSTPTPHVCVTTAERPGRGSSEDRIFQTANAAIVLDGASEPDTEGFDGGWMAETLGTELRGLLTGAPDGDLRTLLREAIATIAERHSLTPGRSPSTTVSIVRWTSQHVDVLVLGDSPVAIQDIHGRTHVVRDDRLANVARFERKAYISAVTKTGFQQVPITEWRALINAQRKLRNRPGGYWIAEAVPEAADHAIHRRWARDEIATVVALTDGVANGIDRYRVPADWSEAITAALRDPAALIDAIHHTEANDPAGRTWTRSKRHDDKAIAVMTFHHAHRL
jgi:hypothetical protein